MEIVLFKWVSHLGRYHKDDQTLEMGAGSFRRPDVFLVQSYEILSESVKFDLRKEYYSEVLSNMPDAARKVRKSLLGDSLMFMIRSLILQRADQLIKAAIDGICTGDGVCLVLDQ